jgi:hypothetical protein
MDRHDVSTQSGDSRAVSTTSSTLMPSTPTAYWMPKVGIHAARSTNCMPGAVVSKRDHSQPATPSSSSAAARATTRAAPSPRTTASSPMAANGMAMSRLISGVVDGSFTS